jgi:hypothetical protein
LQRVSGRRQPTVATNEERARIYRSVMPSPKYNTHDWNAGERYAREQAMDGPPDPITNYAERRG